MSLISLAQHPALPVQVFPDPAALGEGVAREILARTAAAAREGRRFLLGCPGGRTPMVVYQAMGRLAAGGDLSHVVIVMMDEYLVRDGGALRYCALDAHYSCHRAARDEIAGAVNAGLPPARRIPEDQVWFPDPADPAAYDARVRDAGGIDLFLIASGAGDGHVAFNTPGTPADSPSRVVDLPESTRRDNLITFPDFQGVDDVPVNGVTVGLGTIAASREVFLLLHGADKRTAARRVAAAADYDPAWPSTIIHRCHGARIYLDAQAAEGLAVP
jgi:glucosamine-6-phosphate deaminase